jgi:hypothetical protein
MLGLATRRGSLESSQGSETGSEESISLDFPSMMVPSSNSSRPDYLSTFMMKQQPIETMQHHFSQNRSIWM